MNMEFFVDSITAPLPLGRAVDSYKLLDVLTINYTNSYLQQGDAMEELVLRDMEFKMWHARLEFERSYSGNKSDLLFGATNRTQDPPGSDIVFCWSLHMPVYRKIKVAMHE